MNSERSELLEREDCQLLKKLFKYDQNLGDYSGVEGLNLSLGDYDGTMLYRSWTTPSNTLTFANTGGDDVHFGLVALGGSFSDSSPVVMTVPMADEDDVNEMNFIVGENLYDFLCLGYHFGFFDIEQIAYGEDDPFVDAEPLYDEDEELHKEFQKAFGLSPWSDEISTKLSRLDLKYKPLLEYKRG